MISTKSYHKKQSQKKMFVLDDWPDVIELFQRTAQKNNIGVVGASSNDEARKVISHMNLDSIHIGFIDVDMGTDSGLDIFRLLRAEMPKLPMVIMTGRPNNRDLIDIISGDNFTSFLSKPFFMEEISEFITHPCARAGDVRELVELSMFIEDTKLL